MRIVGIMNHNSIIELCHESLSGNLESLKVLNDVFEEDGLQRIEPIVYSLTIQDAHAHTGSYDDYYTYSVREIKLFTSKDLLEKALKVCIKRLIRFINYFPPRNGCEFNYDQPIKEMIVEFNNKFVKEKRIIIEEIKLNEGYDK